MEAAAAAETPAELVFPPGSRIRVLALDGGGIRGAFTAAVLAELEKETGRKVAEHFDMITGTSTGGILAIGLALGIAPERLLEMYLSKGGGIFGSGRPIASMVGKVRQVFRSKHGQAGLRSALEEVLGDRLLGNASQRLVIPTFDALKGTACTFKTAHHPRAIHDYRMRAVDVALATAAAPTFLKAAVLPGRQGASYLDGGIWANSPVLVGIVEAVHFLGGRLEDVHLLSVGTTEEYATFVAQESSGLIGWGRHVVEAMMAAQVTGAQAQARLLLDSRFLRINFQTNRREYPLDDARSDTVMHLAELGRSTARTTEVRVAVMRDFMDGVPAQPFAPVRRP